MSTKRALLVNKVRTRRGRQRFGKSRERYEACQQSDMEVDKEKGMEEVTFVPSAVSDPSAWHETLRVKYMCEKS